MSPAPVQASAPGKIILFGEHAVVYGCPSIAAPVTQVRATASVELALPGAGLTIVASNIGHKFTLATAAPDDPLAVAAQLVLEAVAVETPDATLTLSSTIPIASGLGSGAAVSTALVRALASYLGHPLSPDRTSNMVYQVEKIHHGTPSGIDNTVIVYEQPIYFVKKRDRKPQIERLTMGAPLTLVIGDTGVYSPTKETVQHVRQLRDRNPAHYDAIFDRIGEITDEARLAIEAGNVNTLGPLMDENHLLLAELGVSSPKLDVLVEAACVGGAIGAKLSGAGQGGNMIALVQMPDDRDDVIEALRDAGVKNVICTTIERTENGEISHV